LATQRDAVSAAFSLNVDSYCTLTLS